MDLLLADPMTLAGFLSWEERQEGRFEFDGTRPVAMAGGTAGHATIKDNIVAILKPILRGSPCRVFGTDLKFLTARGSARYPDAMVVCRPVGPDETMIGDPVVVFEVLSAGTARTDRVLKAHEYGATPSVRRYVLLEQAFPAAYVFSRERGDWACHVLAPHDALALPEIGATLNLTDLYEGLDFGTEAAGAVAP